jgi:hypothetical protein
MRIKKLLGAGAASIGLLAGLTGFVGATSGTIGTTGPDSTNTISDTSSQTVGVTNTNHITGNNDNDQSARSGRAEAEHNTTAGGATTGDASNKSSFTANVTVDNTGVKGALSGMMGANNTGSIDTTGPDSTNAIAFSNTNTVSVVNDNHLHVRLDNDQRATSGSAEVSDNTTGGSAVSGNASNDSSSSVTFMVSN